MHHTEQPHKKGLSFTIDRLIITLYFLTYIIIGLSLLTKQPFGNPPDEYNRFLIPSYIAEHGTLPNGYDESIRIPGYGFSYAFQPILPYMIQGYAMRFVGLFTDSASALLYTARIVDFVFGFITALFVLLLSKKWFLEKRIQYLFAFLVTFLPQSIFMHTYVNTDSCCMMSIAIMLYGLTKGLKDHFSYSSCVILSVGIILCALSYYNAYGFILSSILLFTAHYLSCRDSKPAKVKITFDWKPFLKKGIFISVLVLAGISWWFIRSAVLYDGDILGLKSRDLCASLYANPNLRPDTRVTFQNQGYSFFGMLRESDFITLSTLSFIGVYGPMTIVTSIWIYRFYKVLFGVGLFLCVTANVIAKFPLLQKKTLSAADSKAPNKKLIYSDTLYAEKPVFRVFYHCNMIFCILMPCILSACYSYTTDYQPQGRYILPMLIPFCYYCIRGIQKGWISFSYLLHNPMNQNHPPKTDKQKKPAGSTVLNRCFTGLCVFLCIAIVICLCITVYGYAFPYYAANPVAP